MMDLPLADSILDMISDFKTDVGIKEQQLEELLDHNKQMMEISEVLEHAANMKKDDIAKLKQTIDNSTKTIASGQKDFLKCSQELQLTQNKLMNQCEENGILSREMETQRNIVQNMKFQLDSSQTTINILESENQDLDRWYSLLIGSHR